MIRSVATPSDEQAIRSLIVEWHAATARGDVDAVLELMTDDVVFLVAGQPPMRGRETFARRLYQILQSHRIASGGAIQEIRVGGDLAYVWNVLEVQMTPLAGGDAMHRRGNVLSVFRRGDDGRWRLARDANLLVATAP